jgi:hypothetical protein
MATEGASGANLSRASIASSRTVPDTAGGYYFREEDGELTDVVINQSHRKWDGARRMRVRYDTPTIGGTSEDDGLYFSAAYGKEVLQADNDNTYYDVAARYQNETENWSVKASGGYGWIDGDDSLSTYWSGSVSALHLTSGLNATIAAGGDPDTEGEFIYGNAGWIAEFMNAGNTAMGIDYYAGRNTIYAGAQAAKWGIHFVQYVDALNLQVYVAYDVYTFEDESDATYQDASATMAGVFWKF